MFELKDSKSVVTSMGGATVREFFIDNLLVRIHFIIELSWWTGLAPWEFEFPFPGSLTSAFQGGGYKGWVVRRFGISRSRPGLHESGHVCPRTLPDPLLSELGTHKTVGTRFHS